jgi:amino acid transporter
MQRKSLTLFGIVMITVTSVDSIRNLPSTALFGPELIFFFVAAALFFLIPTALVSAELASAYPEEGGVYVWVKRAFGERVGFLAIWLQWTENVVWYPTILSFVAGTLAYLFYPDLANNKYYLIGVIWSVFWGTTFLNLRGLAISTKFSIVCGLLGLFVPMAMIIFFGTLWVAQGHPLQITFHPHDLLPNFSDPTLFISLTGVLLSYSGMELTTVYANQAKNPQRDYPRGLAISAIFISVTLILGSLAIAIIVPQKNLSLVSGIMQAFSDFFQSYHLTFLLPVMAVCIILGALGGISNWTLAPVEGLLITAKDNLLPKFFEKKNRYNSPRNLLLIQGVVVSLISLLFIFMPSINSSYWLINVVASQLYMLMYILMFLAAIYLRFKYPKQHRPFKVFGGKWGLFIVCAFGIISATITFFIGFIPPTNMSIKSVFDYEAIIIALLFIMIVGGWVACRKKTATHH